MYRIRLLDRTPLKITVPSVGRLAVSPHNKDLEIPPCRLHPNFCYAKTSLNPDVIGNKLKILLMKKISYYIKSTISLLLKIIITIMLGLGSSLGNKSIEIEKKENKNISANK